MPTRLHLRSRSLVHRPYSAKAKRRDRVQLADQAEHLAIELRFGQRQRRVRANQCARCGVGCETVEIRIAHDRGALLGHLEQARLHPVEIVGAERSLADDAAAEIALADPDRILLDRRQAIGQAGEPGFDRRVQLLGGGGKRGVTAEQLIARIANPLAVVLGKQRQPVGDGGWFGLREARCRWQHQRCKNNQHIQHSEAHSLRLPALAAAMLASRMARWNGVVLGCWYEARYPIYQISQRGSAAIENRMGSSTYFITADW